MAKPPFSQEFIKKWDHVLSDLEMGDNVPIEYVERLELYFNNGRPPAYIDVIGQLEKHKPWKVEQYINGELDKIRPIIDRVEYHLNITKVVDIIETATNNALKDM